MGSLNIALLKLASGEFCIRTARYVMFYVLDVYIKELVLREFIRVRLFDHRHLRNSLS